jgi:hypothetical protein
VPSRALGLMSLAFVNSCAHGVAQARTPRVGFVIGSGHPTMETACRRPCLATDYDAALPASGRLGLSALLECAQRQLWVVRAEDTAFERASLKARG